MDWDGPDNRELERETGTAGLPNISAERTASPLNVFRFEFLRRKGSGLACTPKKSGSLEAGSWIPLTGTPDVISIDATWERVIYEEPYDLETTERCFGRVEVTLPGG